MFAFANSVYAMHTSGHTELDCMVRTVHCNADRVMLTIRGFEDSDTVTHTLTYPGPYTYQLNDHPGLPDFDSAEVSRITEAPTGGELRLDIDTNNLEYYPQLGTDTDMFEITGDAGGRLEHVSFEITVVCPPAGCQTPMPMQTTRRKNADDKFDEFAIYSGVAILGNWAFNKYIINAPVKFSANPTSNKSLQYNLSANLNKSWSANFTVDKSVKMNSETNDSNLYKLKFEYQF